MLINVNIKSGLIALLVLTLFGGAMFFIGMRSVETIPSKPTIVTLPALHGTTEVVQLQPSHAVYINKPGKPNSPKVKVDSVALREYLIAKDSIAKLNVVIGLATIETVKTTHEDNSVKIDVTSEVRGGLISQYVDYTIKPQTVSIIPEEYKVPNLQMYAGGFMTVPLYDPDRDVALGANLMLVRTKQQDMFSVGVDTDRVVYVGYSIRLFGRKK